MGLPHAIAVTTANVTDRDGAIQMILLNLDNLSHVEKFLVDAGYSGERFANQVKDICGAQVEVVKRSELHKFVVLPRRWVVERLFGWLDKFRRLWKNCERKLFISAQMLTFALIAILIRRFQTGSKKALVAYAGIDAPPNDSGDVTGRHKGMSKIGTPSLRRTLFLVMSIYLQQSPLNEPVYLFMDKKRSEGKPYRVYMMASANKFLRIYYATVNAYLESLEQF